MAKERMGKLEARRNRSGYVFIAPFLIGFVLFMLIPIVQSFWFSFNEVRIVENGYELLAKGV